MINAAHGLCLYGQDPSIDRDGVIVDDGKGEVFFRSKDLLDEDQRQNNLNRLSLFDAVYMLSLKTQNPRLLWG